jgi:hypothetical protein
MNPLKENPVKDEPTEEGDNEMKRTTNDELHEEEGREGPLPLYFQR